MERRFTSADNRPIEIRAEAGQAPKVEGYAAMYYSESTPGTEYQLLAWPGYRVIEHLMPGCFDRAAKEDDVRALFNHDPSQVLGRTASGTCKLSLDSRGLRYSIDMPDTQVGRDLLVSLKRGDVTGSSFGFEFGETNERDIKQPDGSVTVILEVRSVLRLYDVSPVTYPAYTATSAQARAEDGGRVAEIKARIVERLRNSRGKLARARLLDLD